jgi:hypothetical protein
MGCDDNYASFKITEICGILVFSNVSLSGVEDLICTKAFDFAQNDKCVLFSIFFSLSSSSARGMGAGYRSSADSPTALGKGANEDKAV